jgi:hypothetical protein
LPTDQTKAEIAMQHIPFTMEALTQQLHEQLLKRIIRHLCLEEMGQYR